MGNKFCEVPGLAPRRLAAGLTQATLAEVLHVSKMTVLRWENGQNAPSLEMLRRLAEVLKCSVSDLLTAPAETVQAS